MPFHLALQPSYTSPRSAAFIEFITQPSGSPHVGKDLSPQPDLEPLKGKFEVISKSGPSTQIREGTSCLEALGAQVPRKAQEKTESRVNTCPWPGSCPCLPQVQLQGRRTYDGGSRTLGPGDGAVRDPQGEGFTVALIHLHLPPDAELAHRTPASGETDELDLWWPWDGPGHDDRLIGRLWTMANLEKEAKALLGAGRKHEAVLRHGLRLWPCSWGSWGGRSEVRETREHIVH